jgi:dihydropteroate synthase
MSFEWGRRTYIMGIINVTPDSFSGDGLLKSEHLAPVVEQARRFIEEGADILDLGGESTRPGSLPVSEEEEYSRVIPAIEAVRQVFTDVTISVDTYRSSIASAAIEAGADWINDVWGLRMDPAMAAVVASSGCPIVLMHNRSKPKDVAQEQRLGGHYIGIHYDDVIGDIHRELSEQIEVGLRAGVNIEQIIIDPGIGFGKTVEQNLELLDRLDELKSLGRPMLIGPSRKSFIGYTLDLPSDDRVEGTAAAVAIGIARGADIVRVHDVRAMARVAKMVDSIVRRTAISAT